MSQLDISTPAHSGGSIMAFLGAASRALCSVASAMRSTKIAIGGAIIILLVLGGVFADRLTPYDPGVQSIREKLLPPLAETALRGPHILGTDYLGRDVLSRLIHGSRISLIVGVASVMLSALIGAFLGAIGGYYGGIVDEIIGKISEIFLAFPFLLLAIVIMAFLGPGLGNVILALVLSRWVNFARVMRGEVLSLRNREFVAAARALGASDAYLLIRHIAPHTAPVLILVATFEIALVIIYESSLSFLGLGLPPSIPSTSSTLQRGPVLDARL